MYRSPTIYDLPLCFWGRAPGAHSHWGKAGRYTGIVVTPRYKPDIAETIFEFLQTVLSVNNNYRYTVGTDRPINAGLPRA